MVLGLALKGSYQRQRDFCGESSLTYERLGSLWCQNYLVFIKDMDLCGKASFDLPILLIVTSLLSILIKEGPLCEKSSFDLSIC